MRKISFLIFMVFCSISMAQNSAINLDFNVHKNKLSTKKYLDDDACTHFFIENEHFKASYAPQIIGLKDLNNITLVELKEFIEVGDSIREILIRKGEKEGVIELLSNEEVFNTIYLYEKALQDKVLKHRVVWIEEIID